MNNQMASLNVIKLHDLLVHSIHAPTQLMERHVAGSHPPRKSVLWQRYEQEGYQVHFEARNGQDHSESFVDANLHSVALRCINEHNNIHRNHPNAILILVTGDGNNNYGNCSFPQVVKAALDSGWSVHLWSWQQTRASIYKEYANLPGYQGRFLLHDLDPSLNQIMSLPPSDGSSVKGGHDDSGGDTVVGQDRGGHGRGRGGG